MNRIALREANRFLTDFHLAEPPISNRRRASQVAKREISDTENKISRRKNHLSK